MTNGFKAFFVNRCLSAKILFGFILILSFTSKASATIQPATPYIINGVETNTTEYSSFVSLYQYIDLSNGTLYGNTCGASIINAQHILTAAHCVSQHDITPIEQLFMAIIPNVDDVSETNSNIRGVQKYRVLDIYIHNGYENNPTNVEDDIAVLKLESPLSGVNFSSFQFVDENSYRLGPSSQLYTVVGHGLNYPSTYRTDTKLQKTTLSFVENAHCGYQLGGAPSTQLCMEGVHQNGLENAACQGDSGGPLYWRSGQTDYQVGVVSYGPSTSAGDCGSTTFNGATSVFTEVADYQQWIEDIINGRALPTVTTTEEEREVIRRHYILENMDGTDQPVSRGVGFSGSSGGAAPYWLLMILPLLLWIRQR